MIVDNSWRTTVFWTVVASIGFLLFTILFFVSEAMYVQFGQEDAAIENLSAALYAVAGVLMLFTACKSKDPMHRAVLPALLGLFFVFVAGEEISWGQRILNIETPAAIAEKNTQSELNLHNLEIFDKHEGWLNQHTLLNIFVLLNGILIPIAYHIAHPIRRLLIWFRFPVAPVCSVPVFFLGLFFGQSVAKVWPHWVHTEYKEAFFALGFMLLAISFRSGANRNVFTVWRGRLDSSSTD